MACRRRRRRWQSGCTHRWQPAVARGARRDPEGPPASLATCALKWARSRAITEFKEAIMKQISHSCVGLKGRHGEILCCSSHLKKCTVRNGDLPEDMLQNKKIKVFWLPSFNIMFLTNQISHQLSLKFHFILTENEELRHFQSTGPLFWITRYKRQAYYMKQTFRFFAVSNVHQKQYAGENIGFLWATFFEERQRYNILHTTLPLRKTFSAGLCCRCTARSSPCHSNQSQYHAPWDTYHD